MKKDDILFGLFLTFLTPWFIASVIGVGISTGIDWLGGSLDGKLKKRETKEAS